MRRVLRSTPFFFVTALLSILLFTSATPTYAAISNQSATNDSTNVYYQYNYTNTPTYWHVFIDKDQSTTTGYQMSQGIGADYLLENNSLYKYTGSGGNWSWSLVKSVTYSNSSGLAKWTVARSDIGDAACPNADNLVFETESKNGSTLDTTGLYTHTFSGCGGATNTPTSTSAPVATNTPLPPTNTPVPTFQPPTNTPGAATATFTPTSVPSGSSYYVAATGSDSNNGSLSAPWRHIQYAVNTVPAGSTINVRGGVYNEQVTFSRSGSASTGYFTLQSYPGETAIVDATAVTVTAVTIAGATAPGQGLITVGANYVKVLGLEVRNFVQSSGQAFPIGILVWGSSGYVEIRNNNVHNIENSCSRCGAHGIGIYGTSSSSINHLIIDGNNVHDNKLGWSESLVVNGNVDGWTISNNTVHDNDNIGIDAIGYEGTCANCGDLDRARNGSIVKNHVYNIDSKPNPAYHGQRSADGIYVDGGTSIVIERNTVDHANIGIELASEHSGKTTSYITARSNFVSASQTAGFAMGGYDTKRGSTIYCTVVNNTFYNNDTDHNGYGELWLQYDVENSTVKNNIFYPNAQNIFITNAYTQNINNVVDYNLFFSAGGISASQWQWKTVVYTTFSAYQTGSGNDAHSQFANPLLASPDAGDLHITAGSPAINAGQNLTIDVIGTSDIDGAARIQGGQIDVGADELQ